MKQPPKGAIFEKRKMPKVKYLQSALGRLDDEVGTYFEMLEQHNKTHDRLVGFWSSIRILMPIIEAIAHVVDEKPQDFLESHLDVEAPYLTWDLFRHSLIHGDYVQHAKYDGKRVEWGILLMGVGNIADKEHIGIDPIFLYKKLRGYLKMEIGKNDQSLIEFEVGVIYRNPKKEIIDEFNKL